LAYDGGNGGNVITPPVGWLEDYWMGRYYGFIEAPKDPGAEIATIRLPAATSKTAKPYTGPSRPDGKWAQ
jgi:hypothetical protein